MLKVKQIALASVALAAITSISLAAPIALTEGNTTFIVDPFAQAGASQWSIGGNNQLNQQFFWYRVGSGSQFSVENGATSITTTTSGTDKLSVKYNYGGLYTIDVHYNINSLAGNSAQLEQSVGITNISGGTLNINFYQYNDFNLAGTAGFDEVFIDNSAALQQEGSLAITEGGIDPLAFRFEGNVTGWAGSTLDKLNTSSDLLLNNNGAASGDATWAFQWQFDLTGAGSGREILKGQNLAITLVPEPTTISLAAVGLVLAGLLKKQRAKA